MVIRPRNSALRRLFDVVYPPDDGSVDKLSKHAEQLSRMTVANRLMRGNVELQNSAIITDDYSKMMRDETWVMLKKRKNKKR